MMKISRFAIGLFNRNKLNTLEKEYLDLWIGIVFLAIFLPLFLTTFSLLALLLCGIFTILIIDRAKGIKQYKKLEKKHNKLKN